MGWNDNNERQKYVSSKDFIPFCQPQFYDPDKNSERYNGYVDLKITCYTDIYIGSGFAYMSENNKQLVYQTIMYDGKPIIPGSSLKGVVRNLASAASNGCLPEIKYKNSDARYPYGIKNIKCNSEKSCIVCDIFGAMSKGSKVMFSDLHSDNAKLVVRELNEQHSPQNIYTEKDGTAKGYKLYKIGENNYNMKKIRVQVVAKGAVFTGRVHFKRLTEEELSLFMFALGLDDSSDTEILLKIGGFKNEGIGEIDVKSSGFNCSGNIKKSAGELAYQYYDMATANETAIDKIYDILGKK